MGLLLRALSGSVLMAGSLPAWAAGDDVTLKLHPRVLLAGREYRVADVAAIGTADRQLAARVGQLPLGTLSKPGGADHLWRSQVARVIEAAHPELRGRLQWSGPERAELRIAAAPVDQGEIETVARDYLTYVLRQDHERVELTRIVPAEPLVLPAGAVELRPRLAGSPRASRRMCVWVDVLVDGAAYRAIPVWFAVSAQRVVLVAASSLAAGTVLAPEHFVAELRELAGLAGSPAARHVERNALRLKRALGAGEMLAQDHVEPVPAVARNQEVTVRVSVGAISVETPGVALADGKLGTTVRVRNARSNETFRARVVDNGVVSINPR